MIFLWFCRILIHFFILLIKYCFLIDMSNQSLHSPFGTSPTTSRHGLNFEDSFPRDETPKQDFSSRLKVILNLTLCLDISVQCLIFTCHQVILKPLGLPFILFREQSYRNPLFMVALHITYQRKGQMDEPIAGRYLWSRTTMKIYLSSSRKFISNSTIVTEIVIEPYRKCRLKYQKLVGESLNS